MFARSPILRVASGLVALTCSILVSLDLLGLMPSAKPSAMEERIALCEALATQAVAAIDRNDFASVRALLQMSVRRNEDVLSAGVRAASGRLLVSTSGHAKDWIREPEGRDKASYVEMPLFRGGERWGAIEVHFAGVGLAHRVGGVFALPLVRMLLLFCPLGFLAFWAYMKWILKHLDPTAVIPARVQKTLDVMAEGVVLLDSDERIVLANDAFASRTGRSPQALLGTKLSALDWRLPNDATSADRYPWLEALEHGRHSTGTRLILESKGEGVRSFMVNGAPILGEDGQAKGVIATFDDVTELQRKTLELQRANEMLESANEVLEKSQDEIRLQKEELELLARRDPLTDVSNRRYFMSTYEAAFNRAHQGRQAFACLMLDIDHFKRVNDNHGHAMGDAVIKCVAEALRAAVRSTDAVCRYGGEEFCVVLAGASTTAGAAVAERIRRRIEEPDFAPIRVTASLGVSSIEFGCRSFAELINQADEALYASKQAGRNRVTRYDEVG